MKIKNSHLILGTGVVCFAAGLFGGGILADRSAGSGRSDSASGGVSHFKDAAGQDSGEGLYRDVLGRGRIESFEDAVNEVARSSYGAHRKALLHLTIHRWSEEDPNAALAYVSGMKVSEGQAELFSVVFRQMGKADFGAALEMLSEYGTIDNSSELLTALYSGAAEADPRHAIMAAEDLPGGPERASVLRGVIEVWAKQDVAGALEWVGAQDLDTQLEEFYRTVMIEYTHQQPEYASHLIKEMSSGDLKNGLAGQYSLFLCERGDVRSAVKWAESLGEDRAKIEAITVAFDGWLKTDADGAFRYALKAEAQTRVSLLEQAAVRMSQVDPVEASANLGDFPEEARAVAAEQIAIAWAEKDPQALVNWIGTLDVRSRTYRQAVAGAIYPLSHREPETAFNVAAGVVDSSRNTFLNHAARAWFKVDPDAALDAVNGDALMTDQEKHQLASMLSSEGSTIDVVLPALE